MGGFKTRRAKSQIGNKNAAKCKVPCLDGVAGASSHGVQVDEEVGEEGEGVVVSTSTAPPAKRKRDASVECSMHDRLKVIRRHFESGLAQLNALVQEGDAGEEVHEGEEEEEEEEEEVEVEEEEVEEAYCIGRRE